MLIFRALGINLEEYVFPLFEAGLRKLKLAKPSLMND